MIAPTAATSDFGINLRVTIGPAEASAVVLAAPVSKRRRSIDSALQVSHRAGLLAVNRLLVNNPRLLDRIRYRLYRQQSVTHVRVAAHTLCVPDLYAHEYLSVLSTNCAGSGDDLQRLL
jgi:hypothetical protein